jgi:hypothetical protein
MRLIFAALVLGVLFNTGCKKNTCNRVTIVDTGNPCVKWGIKKNAKIYPVDSIPTEFQQEGMVVCAKYELYEDMRLCPTPCCGGTRAKIISMSVLPD